MEPPAKQMNTNMTFNPRTSGSLSVTASSGHTAASTEETDLDMTLPSNIAADYTQSSSYSNQGNSKSFWNQAVMSGYPAHNSGLGNLLESPQLDDQEIQLPSFMFNSIYTQGNQETFKTGHYPSGIERAPLNTKDYNNINNRRAAGKDTTVSPLQPFINQYGSNNQIIANASKKKSAYSGNFNPRVASYDGRTASSETKTSSLSDSNNFAKAYNSGSQAIEANTSDSLEMLGIELSYKTQVNKAMYAKLLSLNVDNGGSIEAELQTEKDSLRLPQNYYQLFRDLTHTLNERTQELEETKSIMEAILVSLVMTKDSTITTNGTFDAQDLAHKITSKMAVLQSENEALLQMVSHSNKQSLVIELGILKSENHALREKIKELGLQD